MLREYGKTALAHPFDDLIHVEGVEQHDGVEGESQGAEAVLHAFVVPRPARALRVGEIPGAAPGAAGASPMASSRAAALRATVGMGADCCTARATSRQRSSTVSEGLS